MYPCYIQNFKILAGLVTNQEVRFSHDMVQTVCHIYHDKPPVQVRNFIFQH